MSLIFTDGFDDGLATLGKWGLLQQGTIVAGRNGNGLRLTNSNTVSQKTALAPSHATMTVGFAMMLSTAPSSTATILTLFGDSAVTGHMLLELNISRTISVSRGAVLLVVSTGALQLNQWYYVEFKTTLGDSPNGSYELRVNGSVWASGTNTDTKNGGTGNVFDGLAISSNNNANIVYDDLYVCNGAGSTNTSFLGDVSIETLYPDGNGNSSQWVGSDANSTDNYLLVDETTPSTADYVGGANVGDKDTYTFGSLTRTSGTIRGVAVTSYSQKSDSGARTMRHVARSNATEATGTSLPLATTWLPHQQIFETDPDGGGSWTVGSVNAAEFGAEVDS